MGWDGVGWRSSSREAGQAPPPLLIALPNSAQLGGPGLGVTHRPQLLAGAFPQHPAGEEPCFQQTSGLQVARELPSGGSDLAGAWFASPDKQYAHCTKTLFKNETLSKYKKTSLKSAWRGKSQSRIFCTSHSRCEAESRQQDWAR